MLDWILASISPAVSGNISKVVDATLRDGGLVNDFYFTDEFVKALYQANIDAGVDYMEMGYRASKKQFKENEFGKWKFATDDDIYAIVGDNDTDLKLATSSLLPRTIPLSMLSKSVRNHWQMGVST